MQNITIMSRLGGTALAAVLALSATPAFAQEATPQITVPQEQAAPATAAPVTVTPVTTPAPVVTPDPLAAEPAAQADTTPATTEATPAATTAKKATSKATARTTSAPRASAAPTAPVAAPVDATLPAEAPVIDPPIPVGPLAAAPAPVSEAAPVETATSNDALPIALGAGLGLLALGGAAFALRRRRRDVVEDEVIMTEPTITRTPAPAVRPEPVMADRSAFSWGTPAATATAATTTSSSGKSWVERAQDGPTPENPFLSLKKRLQRAAFYDQRERAVAAGQAKPLSPMAGLPSRFAQTFKPRTSAPASSYGFSYAPA